MTSEHNTEGVPTNLMNNPVTEEYKIIRHEIQSVKDCITRYISFVLGGSGIAAFGFSYIYQLRCEDSCGVGHESAIAIAIVVSFLITFITAIILYKAHSHNRYAGYSKAIGNERIKVERDGLQQNDLYLWEECLSSLRKLYLHFMYHEELVGDDSVGSAISDKELFLKILKAHAGSDPLVDYHKRRKGFKRLLKALVGKVFTNSWGFPPYIVAINFVMSFLFSISALGFAFYALAFSDEAISNVTANSDVFVAVLASLSLLVQGAIWANFCGKLFSLMAGINTVDSFFVRFAPIRAKVLSEFGIQSSYACLNDTLQAMEPDVDRIKQEMKSKKHNAVEK